MSAPEASHTTTSVMEKVGPNIISHVSNSELAHPIIHLPTIYGIDFSVTKHVLMLWLVAFVVSISIIIPVRKYLSSGSLIPSGWMNAIEAIVKFIRDSIAIPNLGQKWVMTWAPVLLTFFFFILFANGIGMVPIFDVLGSRFTHIGPVGSGQVAKIANQMIVGLTIGAVAEAFTLASRSGIDLKKVLGALKGGFADSRILNLHGERMINGNFLPGGKCKTQCKDLNLALSLAEKINIK